MRPVEIEFLVKDSTKAGAQRVSASIDRETMKILGKMDRVQAKIDKLRSTNNEALDQAQNIAEIQKLESQLDKLQAKMSKVAATKSIGPSANEIASVTSQYNGLNASIQQIARELPAAAMGPQMFFMAISNNLPIFADELSRARKEYAAMTAAGEKGTPVWKQMLSSIFSWQTALAVGIMLLVTYGKEIGNLVMSLFKGADAMEATKIATEQFHSTMAQGAVSAQKEITTLELLYKVATDTSRSYNERKHAVDELQQSYPAYFANLTEEQIMLGNALAAYEKLRDTIYQVAEAKAAENKLVQIAENRQLLESVASMQRYIASYNELSTARNAYNDAQRRMKGTEGTRSFVQASKDAQRAASSYEQSLTDLKRVQEDIFKELANIEGGEDLVTLIKETYGGDLQKYIEAQDKLREQLVKTAESTYTQKSYKDKQFKATSPDVQGRDQLLQAMRDLEDEQNAIIEDGYEKRRAIAKTEFERQLHDIRVNREKLLAEDKKDTGGANAGKINTIFDAQIMAAAGRYNQTLKQIEQDQQAATTEAYNNLLEKYETYLQKRERLTREYDKDIAALATSPENQAVAEQAKEKALQDLDIAFAQQFPQFEQWANSIVTQSVYKLRELIALAEFELEQMESDNNADPEALAKARAEIAMLRQKLAEILGKKSGDGDDGYERWERLSDVLGRVNDDLQEVGDTLGGVIGEVIDTAGTIATSTITIISGVKQLSKLAAEGVKGTAEAGAAAMTKLEKASVILTIISAGLQVVQAIAGLLRSEESSQERNIRLAKEFNEELRIMNERARINQDDDSIFGDAIYKNFKNNIDVVRKALRDLEEDRKAIAYRNQQFNMGLFDGILPINPNTVAASIGEMLVMTQHATWVRSAKYASLKDLLPELFGEDGQVNMDALKKFADENNDTFKKLSASNQKLIKSLVSDWETYEQALESVRDYISSIFGELGNDIMDSMLAVADGTMTAADAMTSRLEALSDIVRNFGKDMIYAMTIGPLLDEAQKQIENIKIGDGSEEQKYSAMLEVLSDLMTNVQNEQDTVNGLWQQLQTIAQSKGIDWDAGVSTTQKGKAGAIYTVSQDSFNRVEGIATSIQAHIASVDLKFDNIAQQFSLQLEAMNAIVTNTSPIAAIYALLLTIQRDGLNVK